VIKGDTCLDGLAELAYGRQLASYSLIISVRARWTLFPVI